MSSNLQIHTGHIIWWQVATLTCTWLTSLNLSDLPAPQSTPQSVPQHSPHCPRCHCYCLQWKHHTRW